MVREAIGQYREIAGQKGIVFEQDFWEDSIIVCCNRNHLLFALRNLLSNAIKFSNPGSTVKVHLQPEDGRVKLSVEDFGIGIPADKLDAIYSSEATFRRSGTSGEPSHGIGLAVSRELVASTGGKLTVHSAAGNGRIFTITIPGGLPGD
jgi:signal transduction histidine kinase